MNLTKPRRVLTLISMHEDLRGTLLNFIAFGMDSCAINSEIKITVEQHLREQVPVFTGGDVWNEEDWEIQEHLAGCI
jgi:hypothetical protein